MGGFLERVKKHGTIQPSDCKCLPEMAKHMLQFALEDKIDADKKQMESISEAVNKYPTIADRVDAGLRDNEQYQKGLVNAKDILGWAPSRITVDELKESIKAHQYMVSQIQSIPNCR